MRSLFRFLRFLFVQYRSLTVAIFVLALAFIVAFSTGFWLMSRLANVILAAIPLAYVWSRLNLRGLDVAVERPVDRLQEGHEFEERITVMNRGWVTQLWR